MRKNGVNREIREIGGGVCAPRGFRSARSFSGEIDYFLTVCNGRYPVASLPLETAFRTADGKLSETLSKDGLAKAVLFARGTANLFCKDGESTARATRSALAKSLVCAESDVLLFSSGRVTGKPCVPNAETLGALTAEPSLFARLDGSFSFEFDLGDFPVKFGCLLYCPTAGAEVFATQIFLTTDVKITAGMLEKAFFAAYRDTFGLLPRTPFDCAVAIASGEAGNYTISTADGEYAKFADALLRVMERLLKERAFGRGNRLLQLTVSGGRSKRTTRAAVKSLSLTFAERKAFDFTAVLSALAACEGASGSALTKAEIRVYSLKSEIVLMESGTVLPHNAQNVGEIFDGEEAFLSVDLGEGNYSSTAWVKI